MTKKTYTFEFDAVGRCAVSIVAESEQEAVEILRAGDNIKFELTEWDSDMPRDFDELSADEVMRHCSAKDEC